MAEVVATGLLSFVSDKLASKVILEFASLVGIHKELKKLEGTLSTIQDVLEDAETRQVKERALSSWLKKLKNLAYDADDVLDDFAIKALKLKPGAAADMKEKLRRSFFYFPKNIAFRHNIAQRVKEINERLDEIAQERLKFHLKEGVVWGSSFKTENGLVREEIGSFINESEVYGRQYDREQIVELLTRSSAQDHNIGVISIVGLGGLGKTTLAQLVFNDGRICDHFEKRIWVSVSNDFEMRRLVGLIQESVTTTEFCPKNIDTMEVSLRESLMEKRFLLVLDDVWNESHEKWDRLRTLLTIGARGSKVMVTTRSERVASIMGTIPPYRLSTLSLDDCWLLFERRAFGNGIERNPNLIEIGREIVKKCGGVPLAAKALGSLLRFKRTESGWVAIKDSELWNLSRDENNEILPALKLSYDHLSSSVKQCFAYCSIFPKDCTINTDTLVKLWQAEGFLKPSGAQMDLVQIGLQYVDELLERSLFHKSVEGIGVEPIEVKMHDLIHDLARSVAGDECSIVDVASRRYLSQNSRFASIISGKEELSAALQPLNYANKLRTLYLCPTNIEATEEGKHLVDEFLQLISSGVNLLRALHLSGCPLKVLPDSFKKLKHLRYLNISNTHLESFPPTISTLLNLQTLILHDLNFKSVPNSIGNLLNLSTLDLRCCSHLSSLPSSIGQLKCLLHLDLSRTQINSLPESICDLSNLHTLGLKDCYFIQELPHNMSNMKSLVHLNLEGCEKLTCMPKGLGKLSQLRTMQIFIPGGKTCCSLAELGDLKLEGELEIKMLHNVRRIDEAKDARLNEKNHIKSLKLSWDSDFLNKQDGSEDEILKIRHIEDVLRSLQPSKSLRELEIQGYLGRTFPRWMMELSISNLVSLTLSFCVCRMIPALGRLPQLEVLSLKYLPVIKSLDWDFYGGNNAFPSLKELELNDMAGLEEWINVGDEQFQFLPCLHKLALLDCPKLKELPSNFSSVTTLIMNADDELLLSSLQTGAFPNLKHLSMKNYDDEGPMPQVLIERHEFLDSWSLCSKPEPKDGDSTIMTSNGFSMTKLTSAEHEITLFI